MESDAPLAGTAFAIQPLPGVLRLAGLAAAKFSSDAPVLQPERLLAAASRKARLPARFPAFVREALAVLCRSLAEDAQAMHWFGRLNQYHLIVTGLCEYLRVEEAFRRQPQLLEMLLLAPVIVTGLPRSGTTFLHRLLSASGEGRGVLMHWHCFPVPRTLRTGLLEATLLFEPWRLASRSYRLDSIHLVRPWLPDECNFGMRLSLHSPLFWTTAPAYQYLDWLLAQDMGQTYAFYRKTLILYQLRAGGRRLVLKCPCHLLALPALRRALPEALIVVTHRDPQEVVASDSSLMLSLHAVSMRALDCPRTVAANYRRTVEAARRAVEFCSHQSGADLVHVDYRQLLSDPVRQVATIHDKLALGWSSAYEQRLAAFHAANRQHKHGRHRYSLEQFGLDPIKVTSDFSAYRQRFQLA